MKMNRLKHLYVEELKDLYSAENQLVKALPKMAKAAIRPKMSITAIHSNCLRETAQHDQRKQPRNDPKLCLGSCRGCGDCFTARAQIWSRT
jgi:hypothetical protein